MILLVEDDPAHSELIKRHFEKSDIEILCVHSISNANQVIKTFILATIATNYGTVSQFLAQILL